LRRRFGAQLPRRSAINDVLLDRRGFARQAAQPRPFQRAGAEAFPARSIGRRWPSRGTSLPPAVGSAGIPARQWRRVHGAGGASRVTGAVQPLGASQRSCSWKSPADRRVHRSPAGGAGEVFRFQSQVTCRHHPIRRCVPSGRSGSANLAVCRVGFSATATREEARCLARLTGHASGHGHLSRVRCGHLSAVLYLLT